jgi:hypothetical protein
MNDTKRDRLRHIGLTLFWLGWAMLPLFSILVPGAELWKQAGRWAFLFVGFSGFVLYAIAIIGDWRSDE